MYGWIFFWIYMFLIYKTSKKIMNECFILSLIYINELFSPLLLIN